MPLRRRSGHSASQPRLDPHEAVEFVAALKAGKYEQVIFLIGVAVHRLAKIELPIDQLPQVVTIARGPKPATWRETLPNNSSPNKSVCIRVNPWPKKIPSRPNHSLKKKVYFSFTFNK